MTQSKRILFFGVGNLGGQVLDQFARMPGDHVVGVVSRDGEHLQRRANLSMLAANQLGQCPNINVCGPVDLRNVEHAAQVIASFRPDIIFSAVSLQSWWVISGLPRPVFEELDQAHVGPWLPMHLTLVYNLMKAVRFTGMKPVVINASYPDVVHPVLSKVGLAPTVGIGNVANNIPGLRQSIALKLGEPLGDVSVRFIAQHYVSHRVSRAGNSGGAPFCLRAYVRGENRTSELEMDDAFDLLPTRFRRVGGVAGQVMTAASAISVLEAVANGLSRRTHAPAPHGLPGGYPISVDGENLNLDLPADVTLEDAIKVNEGGQPFDGIQAIHGDGSVTFSDRHMSVMRKILGYDCSHMKIEESEDRADELQRRYAELVGKLSHWQA